MSDVIGCGFRIIVSHEHFGYLYMSTKCLICKFVNFACCTQAPSERTQAGRLVVYYKIPTRGPCHKPRLKSQSGCLILINASLPLNPSPTVPIASMLSSNINMYRKPDLCLFVYQKNSDAVVILTFI